MCLISDIMSYTQTVPTKVMCQSTIFLEQVSVVSLDSIVDYVDSMISYRSVSINWIGYGEDW